MATVSSGGASAASAPAAGASAAAAAPEAPKKEEKKVVEEDVDMGDLFGGGDDYWRGHAKHCIFTHFKIGAEDGGWLRI